MLSGRDVLPEARETVPTRAPTLLLQAKGAKRCRRLHESSFSYDELRIFDMALSSFQLGPCARTNYEH